MRLPTEAEYVLISGVNRREANLDQDPVTQYGGSEIAEHTGFNLQLAYGAECPVNGHKANDAGIHDAAGNVWEWCDTVMEAFDGSRPNPLYMDFSQPCCDGLHQLVHSLVT